MTALVYDASALLAVMFDERGADRAMEFLALPGGEISAVNWSEAAAKLAERGLDEAQVAQELGTFGLQVIPFDVRQAGIAAALRQLTRELGLSLGDRCCLALARVHEARVITADSAWLKVEGFDVVSLRDRLGH